MENIIKEFETKFSTVSSEVGDLLKLIKEESKKQQRLIEIKNHQIQMRDLLLYGKDKIINLQDEKIKTQDEMLNAIRKFWADRKQRETIHDLDTEVTNDDVKDLKKNPQTNK